MPRREEVVNEFLGLFFRENGHQAVLRPRLNKSVFNLDS